MSNGHDGADTEPTAYGLLRTAIRLDDPVLFLEHKGLYGQKGLVQRGEFAEVGKAVVVREGGEMTLVATLLMVQRAPAAAQTLASEGIEAEVIDPSWLNPLVQMVTGSVEKTGRLVVVEEQPHAAGWGATVISRLAMAQVPLRAAPAAVSLPDDLPIAYSPPLQDAIVPSPERIADAARAAPKRR